MSVLLASDLDRTLIYSADARSLGGDDAPTVCVETYAGRDLSFMTVRAAHLLDELAARAAFVPVTTRTIAQFRRVRLPASRFAVTTNGAALLVDGVPDPRWSKRIRDELASVAPLDEVWTQLALVCRSEFTSTLRNAEDVFCYAVVVPDRLPADLVPALAEWAGVHGWQVSLQGRKLYCVPRSVTKSAAVGEVARRASASELLAAGDSLLDIDLLLAADRAIRPAHGELFEQGWSAPTVECTRARGIAAGEEIVGWFASGARHDLAVQ